MHLSSKQWLITVAASALLAIALMNINTSTLDIRDDIFMIPVPGILAPGKSTRVDIGEKIVTAAFNSSYSDLIETCNIERKDYVPCLLQMFLLTKNRTHESSKKWPWWYKTLLRDAYLGKTKAHGRWHVLQYKNPNMQQCIAEKAGTKVWRDLHCLTIEDKEEKEANKKLSRKVDTFNCFYLQADRIAGSDRVVFTRDPLDRFLSGFLDKCLGRKIYAQGHCEPNVVFMHNGSHTPVSDFQTDSHTLFEMYVDTFPLTWDLHFIPQSLYCDGLYRHFGNYSFVGSMDRGMYTDLRRFGAQYPQLEGAIEKTFKLSASSEGKESHGVETKASEKTLSYYTPRTVRKVLEYYSVDYVMLGIPIPKWAEDMLAQVLLS
jgi:hypothetical protein